MRSGPGDTVRYLVSPLFSTRELWTRGDGRFYIQLSVATHTGKVVPSHHSLGGDVGHWKSPDAFLELYHVMQRRRVES